MRRPATGQLALWLLGAVIALSGPACFVSPRPEPPQADIELDRIFTDPFVYGTTVEGGPGAASPAGAAVRATSLESVAPPVEALIRDDGSFELELDVNPGDEVRFQVVTSTERGEPVDAVIGADGGLSPAERALAGCLILAPPAELDLSEAGAVTVRNGCGEEVRLQEPRLRRPLAGIEIGGDLSWPLTVADGDEIRVRVAGETEPEREEIFFIEASAPEPDRRPITIVPP